MTSRLGWKPYWAVPLAVLAASASAVSAEPSSGQPGWPTPGQIELVRDRRAIAPVATLVSSVDWYGPLETVRGAKRPRPLPTRSPDRATISRAAIDAAVAYADARKSHALLIWRRGALEIERYWPGFDAGSRYDTASMHKTVLALAIGKAVSIGRIGSVDDPLSKYLPYLKGTRRGGQPLRALLEMASGVETPPSSGGDGSPYWQYALGDDLRSAIDHWPDGCAPRTEFCYANANSAYLGLALEAAVGMRYADWLSQAIWRPIGAGDARVWLDREGGHPRYSCCLQATARDWVRVGRLLLDKGRAGGRRVLPAAWIEAMAAPSAANANYGWQLWRGSPHEPSRRYGKAIRASVPAAAPFARDDVLYLDGSGGQRVYVIPSEDMVIVRIGAPSFDWDDSALPNMVLSGLE